MTTFVIEEGNELDERLEDAWEKWEGYQIGNHEVTINNWKKFLESEISGVVQIDREFQKHEFFKRYYTVITFESEEAKMWFLLKWG